MTHLRENSKDVLRRLARRDLVREEAAGTQSVRERLIKLLEMIVHLARDDSRKLSVLEFVVLSYLHRFETTLHVHRI